MATMNAITARISPFLPPSTTSPKSSLQPPSNLSLFSSIPIRHYFSLSSAASTSLPSSRTLKPRSLSVVSAHPKLSEANFFSFAAESEDAAGKLPPDAGVYAVYDPNGDLQFIGLSSNSLLELRLTGTRCRSSVLL